MSRTDDIINVAGHRLSTGALEEVLAAHADVAECAVIGVADEIKGEVPLGLVVLKRGVERSPEDIVVELIAMVRERIGPIAVSKWQRLWNDYQRLVQEKSCSTCKKIADGLDYRVPPTIEDPVVLTEIQASLNAIGYPRQ